MNGISEGITYTKVPNFILEYLMSQFQGSEFKVALANCTKPYGFQQQTERILLSQIPEMNRGS